MNSLFGKDKEMRDFILGFLIGFTEVLAYICLGLKGILLLSCLYANIGILAYAIKKVGI